MTKTKEETVEDVQAEAQTPQQDRRRGGDRRQASGKTRVVIVDGHTLFRRGVRNILELEDDIEVIGEAGSGREAIAVVEELTPDVILMDLSLPAPNGIETTQRIKRELPHTGVIVLAPNDDEDQLFDAIKAGAAAYVLKDIDPTDLIAIITGPKTPWHALAIACIGVRTTPTGIWAATDGSSAGQAA